ncbi:MAG TPA: GNAT family N-acetyltransferase [Devosia sp.]|nr:GNAT family N-acetyltransferase [Devosia sp.]
MFEIRSATPADMAELIALDAIAPGNAARRDAIAEWIELGQCHVALKEQRPAGYVALTRTFFRSPFVEMLQVAAAARRRGIGRALMEHCIAITPKDVKLWTSTNQSNTPMQVLLPRLGFDYCGMFEHLDPGDPELIYVRLPQNEPLAR